jgi:hypothetical protein
MGVEINLMGDRVILWVGWVVIIVFILFVVVMKYFCNYLL